MSNEQVASTKIHICSTEASNLPLSEPGTTLTDIHICSIEASTLLRLSEPITHSCKLPIPYSVAISDQFYMQWFCHYLSCVMQAKHCLCVSINRRINPIMKCSPTGNWPCTIVICSRVWHNEMPYLFCLQERQTGTYLEWLHERHQSSPIQQPYQQAHSIQNTLDEHP